MTKDEANRIKDRANEISKFVDNINRLEADSAQLREALDNNSIKSTKDLQRHVVGINELETMAEALITKKESRIKHLFEALKEELPKATNTDDNFQVL